MHLQSFDSEEEMFAAIEAAERSADARVTEWQTRIKIGDYVMSYNEEEEFWIFSEILDPIAGERALCDMSSEEDREHIQQLEQAWAPGGPKRCRRWGKCYSVFCPDGELGELHISTVTAIIPKLVFEVATREESPPEARDGKVLAHTFHALIVRASHGFVGEPWAERSCCGMRIA
jgi:hypothetical protein